MKSNLSLSDTVWLISSNIMNTFRMSMLRKKKRLTDLTGEIVLPFNNISWFAQGVVMVNIQENLTHFCSLKFSLRQQYQGVVTNVMTSRNYAFRVRTDIAPTANAVQVFIAR